MRKREIITDAPIFDYFHLQSFGEKKDWEWRLQDVHGGMGVVKSTIAVFIFTEICKKNMK